jgi:hypothetical protein
VVQAAEDAARHRPAIGSDAAGEWTLQPEAAVRSVAIVVIDELASTARRWRSSITIRWSRHSVRIVGTIRSATALAFGVRGGVRTPPMPRLASLRSRSPP